MYSGHLINMVELYHMLYRDDKYDKRPIQLTPLGPIYCGFAFFKPLADLIMLR
jgi:hypothetical protein